MDRINASQVAPTATRFLAPERYGPRVPQGAFTLFAGLPGGGKSSLALDLAAHISQAGGRSLICNTEDAPGALRLRLDAMHADLGKIDFAHVQLPGDLRELLQVIEREQIKLVILDPVGVAFGGLIYNETGFRRTFRPINQCLEASGCALLGIHHTIGHISANAHPLQAISGPQGSLKGTARAVWLFGAHPKNDAARVLAHVKNNCGATEDSLLIDMEWSDVVVDDEVGSVVRFSVLDHNDDTKAMALLQHHTDQQDRSRSKVRQFLADMLAISPQPQEFLREQADHVGWAWSLVRRVSAEIGVIRTAQDQQVYWRLPTTPASAPMADPLTPAKLAEILARLAEEPDDYDYHEDEDEDPDE